MGMERTRMWFIGAMVLFGCKATLAPSCSPSCSPEINVNCEPGDGSCDLPQPATPANACPGARRSGITECFPSQCAAGLFCDDRGGLASCRPGCTSDANCGSTEMCIRGPGEAVGRCEACTDDWQAQAPQCRPSRRDGVTPCFPGACSPGQFCVDRGLSHCEPGCVSDENCLASEHCERGDRAAVGVCRPCRQP